MHLDQIILRIGENSFTLLDLMAVGGALALLMVMTAVIGAWRGQVRRALELEYRLAEMAGHLRGFA